MKKPCGQCGATDRFPSGKCRPCTNRRNATPERVRYRAEWAKRKRACDPVAAREREKVVRRRYAERTRSRNAAWREAHPDYWKDYQRAHREECRATYQRWRQANPDVARESSRRWRAANWDLVLASLQRRRARRVGAAGTTTLALTRARFEYFGGRCWMCGGEATCMDHVIALCNGGSNWPSNLRPACRPCNSRKGAIEMRGPVPTTSLASLKRRDFPLLADEPGT